MERQCQLERFAHDYRRLYHAGKQAYARPL